MVKSAALIYISSFLLFEIHAAVIKDEGAALKRVARSPHYCEENGPQHPPPPPPGFPHHHPPPPFFRTQQWSGLTRSSDGTQQGVFSGAAAATGSESNAANGEAFSVASSGIGSGLKGGQSANAHGSGYEKQSGDSQSFQSNTEFGAKKSYSGNGHYSAHNVEALEQSNLGASSGRGDQGQEQIGKYGPSLQASSQSDAFSSNSQQKSYGVGQGTSSSQYHAVDSGDQQKQSGSQYGQLQSGSNGFSGSGQSSTQGLSDTQSTINGALDLASQGLRTSQSSGCSTCGKSSYALSNAKSHSGSAVAVSVGGK